MPEMILHGYIEIERERTAIDAQTYIERPLPDLARLWLDDSGEDAGESEDFGDLKNGEEVLIRVERL